MLELWQTYGQAPPSDFCLSPWHGKAGDCKLLHLVCTKAFMLSPGGECYADAGCSFEVRLLFRSLHESMSLSGARKTQRNVGRDFRIPRCSRNLKALAKVFGQRIVFKNDFKLLRRCRVQEGKGAACTVKHRQPVGDCVTWVVCRIILKGERCYSGQTGQHIYLRMTEHHRNP